MAKNIDDFLSFLSEKINSWDTVKLSSTTKMEDISEEYVNEICNKLYSSTDSTTQKIGSILNSIYTQSRMTFLMSKRIAQEVIKNDENLTYRSCDTATYSVVIAKLTNELLILERIREPDKTRASIFKVRSDSPFYDIICKIKGREYYEAQEKATLRFYDNYKSGKKSESDLKDPAPHITLDGLDDVKKALDGKIAARGGRVNE